MKRTGITILGLAKSGEAAAILALKRGFEIFVSDCADNDSIRERANRLKRLGIDIEIGSHSEKVFQNALMVISPGVPSNSPVVKTALQLGIRVISEIEFAFESEKGDVIGITGSNGKSTTSELSRKIFSDAGIKTFLAGNIGNPYSSIVEQTTPESVTILELSSFQLETIDKFHPRIAMLLNLSPDHLNVHGTAELYYCAKMRIFENQTPNDFAVLWADQPEVITVGERIKSTVVPFSSVHTVHNGTDVRDGFICRNGEKILPVNRLGIPGPHNLLNALAAVAATIPYNLPAQSIAESLAEFHGIEHRLERFLEHNGILFINDSKATNPDSLKYALMSFERPIVLVAGGYDKGADFSELRDLFVKKVKAVVFTGDTGQKMAEQLANGVIFAAVVPDFEQAVRKAITLACPGDIVMLSPGCASFDAFQNFEHRGRIFKELVSKIVCETAEGQA